MSLLRIVVFGDEARVGVMQGDRIVDVNAAHARHCRRPGADDAVPAGLAAFIAAGRPALEHAREAVARATKAGDPAVAHEAGTVRLRAPWVRRARIACAGGNFADHMADAMTNLTGRPMTAADAWTAARAAPPWGFFKVLDDVLGPGDELRHPPRATQLDYEAEAAVVLGSSVRDLRADTATDAVWGVTLMNDWSIRDDLGTPTPLSFNLAKNFDGAASLGPCIVTGGLDPHDIDVELRVNGELRQAFNTRDMIFSFGECLAHLTRDFTFAPGDVLAGGTGTGTALDASERRDDGSLAPDLFLRPGDLVELSSPQIGVLRNRVVAA